jgi:hypothetical protein
MCLRPEFIPGAAIFRKWPQAAVSAMTAILQLSGAKPTTLAGENFFQPEAANVGVPPRWKKSAGSTF